MGSLALTGGQSAGAAQFRHSRSRRTTHLLELAMRQSALRTATASRTSAFRGKGGVPVDRPRPMLVVVRLENVATGHPLGGHNAEEPTVGRRPMACKRRHLGECRVARDCVAARRRHSRCGDQRACGRPRVFAGRPRVSSFVPPFSCSRLPGGVGVGACGGWSRRTRRRAR
jgi:hypothetical protein